MVTWNWAAVQGATYDIIVRNVRKRSNVAGHRHPSPGSRDVERQGWSVHPSSSFGDVDLLPGFGDVDFFSRVRWIIE